MIMSHERMSSPVTRQWIGVLSEQRVGQTWRPSDHEELLRNLRLADELTVLLLKRVQGATEMAEHHVSEPVPL